MAAFGFFPPEARVELIDGLVYDMTPQSSGHTTSVYLAAEALRPAFQGSYLRVQSPLALGERSAPEPDVAVVAGSPRDYRDGHPSTALLVVEVADYSLLHDRLRKLPSTPRRESPKPGSSTSSKALEIYREPVDGVYRSQTVLRAGDSVSPLAGPGISIPVADLLP